MRFATIGLCFALSYLTSFAQAQTACELSLGISVTDMAAAPLEAASISFAETDRVLTSDKAGKLRVARLCVGNISILISKLGYESKHLHMQLQRDSNIVIRMQQVPLAIATVNVAAKGSSSPTNASRQLNSQQLQENKGKLLGESLSELAGVSTIGMGNNIVKPVINGMHSNRILLLNNGIRQEGQQWGVEHAPEIDPFTADRIEVIKGAEAVRYGTDAMAGVVLVSPTEIPTDKPVRGNIDLIGMSNGRGYAANAMLMGGVAAIPNLAWRLQASNRKTGNYKAANYYLGNTGSQELNYAGSLAYSIRKSKFNLDFSHFGTDIAIFEGAHVNTLEDIYTRIEHGRPFETYAFSYKTGAPKQRVAHDLLKASWKQQLSLERSLELIYGVQRNHRKEYDRRRVESDDTPMADMVLNTQSLDILLKGAQSTYGAQALLQVNNNTPGTGTTPIIPNFDSYSFGMFGIRHFNIKRLRFELGLRYDLKHLDIAGYRYDRTGTEEDGVPKQYLLTDSRLFQNLSGTTGLLYPISDKLSLKSNLGLAWRSPSVNELYSDGLHHGSATYELGNADLKSEKGLKWVNSFTWRTERVRLIADIYGQLVSNYIYAQPDPKQVQQTIRGTFPLFSYQQHDALFYGVDVDFSYSVFNTLRYEAQASIVRAKNTELSSYLPYIPSDRVKHGLQWNINPPEQAGLYLRAAHRFVAKQSRYQPDSDYAAPPPAYHLFDATLGKQFKLRSAQTLNITLAVTNVFNKEYKDYLDRLHYFAHQRGRNIQLTTSYKF